MTMVPEDQDQEVQVIDEYYYGDKKEKFEVYGTHLEPLFKAVEVCQFLGLNNTAQALAPLDFDDHFPMKLQNREGRLDKLSVVTEGGFYQLVCRSNKPAAKQFKRWVCKVVLPSIRKTGEYQLNPLKRKREEG